MFDAYYQLICTYNSELFWKIHEQSKPPGYYSTQFKDLITRMLQFNPDERLDMAGVKQHPWMQGQKPTPTMIRNEFTRRQTQVKDALQLRKLEQKALSEDKCLSLSEQSSTAENDNEDKKPLMKKT